MASRLGRTVAVALIGILPGTVLAQQSVTISGRVTSDAGAPLPGANVYIEGMNIGALTGDQGRYSFTLPPARATGQRVTLTARALGFRSLSHPITLSAGTIDQDFVLGTNPLRLGEVVVTGAGTQTSVEKLGNTINTVHSDDIVRSNENGNIVEALAAKAPNVQVTEAAGDPGSSASIRIRGSKTITGTGQPLFVVDGIPIDNSTISTGSSIQSGTAIPNRASDINPDDIESIEILKGAASGAIYGARAGQGVILITTKKGTPGTTHYTLRSSETIDKASTDYPLQTKYGQGSGWASTICTTPDCFVGSTTAASSFGPLISGPSYNHANELFTTGNQSDNNLSVSGGSERTQFFLSGSEYNGQGIIVGPNDDYQRYTARLNASHQLTTALKIGANVSYIDTRGSFIQKGSNTSGLLLGGLRTPPDFNNLPYLDPTTGLQRSFRFPHPSPNSVITTRGYDNPFFDIYQQTNTANSNRVIGNVQADWLPLSWLAFKYTLGADNNGETRLQAIPKTSSTLATGQVLSYQFNQLQIDHNLTGTATWSLNQNFDGTFVLGQNLNSRRFQQEFVQGNTLMADRPYKLSNTLQQTAITDAETDVHTEGYFGQGTFDMFNQLYLTLGLRNDGSSTFSDNSRRNWFPKASLAWTFTDRLNHLGLNKYISFGKLRAAYGEVGQEPSAYALLSVLNAGATFSDGGWGTSVTATQNSTAALFSSGTKGQPSIKPERTSEFEGGMDLGLFGDRADAGITYYNDLSRDVLFFTPLAPSTGFTSQLRNSGKIRNRGWEATFNMRPIQRPNLGWEIGLQYAQNDNKVLQLIGAQFVNQGGSFAGASGVAYVGGRVGALQGNDYIRCGRSDASLGENRAGVTLAGVQAACQGAKNGALYLAPDGFPVVDGTLRQISDPQPRWTGSVNNSIRYKKFRLTGLVDIKEGGQIWNGTKGALYFFGTHLDTQDAREHQVVFGQTWQKGAVVGPGAGTSVWLVCPASQPTNCNPSGTGTGTSPISNWFQGNGGGFGTVGTYFIEDDSYVKLRELSLSYLFDQPWVSGRTGLSSIEVKLAGRNLHTWTKYTGWDPETNLAGAEVPITGVDFFNNPQTRSFVLTMTLNR